MKLVSEGEVHERLVIACLLSLGPNTNYLLHLTICQITVPGEAKV